MDTREEGANRLALGSAQLGDAYGIANRQGQLSYEETAAILEMAIGAGVRCFDTAAGYGEAELRIGRYLREHPGGREVNVITKLPVGDARDEVALRAAVAERSKRLGVVPAGVLLHDPEQLANWQGALGAALQACRAEGAVKAIGVSVYHPEQFAEALAVPGLDIIQAPSNVLDRRLEQMGLLEQARQQGIHVMLRSVFLQGLLLLDLDRCPPALGFALPRLRRWHEVCDRHRVDPVTAALRFVMQRVASATIVVGCESKKQLSQLLEAANAPDLPADLLGELEGLATSDTALLDPTRWVT
jgi:aryl-alcohol dehydrogenase-like predicted oxidoreductase